MINWKSVFFPYLLYKKTVFLDNNTDNETVVGILYFGGNKMNGPFESAQMNDYFSTLSPVVQQAVLHSGTAPKTLSDLQSLAGKMSDSHPHSAI